MAIFSPGFTLNVRFDKIGTSGLDGYAKLIFRNSIERGCTLLAISHVSNDFTSLSPVVKLGGISGLRSIMLNIRSDAATAFNISAYVLDNELMFPAIIKEYIKNPDIVESNEERFKLEMVFIMKYFKFTELFYSPAKSPP